MANDEKRNKEMTKRIRTELLKYNKVEMVSKLCLLLGYTFLISNIVLFKSNIVKGDLPRLVGHLIIVIISLFCIRKSYTILEKNRNKVMMEFLETVSKDDK